MFKLYRKYYWKVGLTFTIISFLIVFVGVKVILGNNVSLRNIIAYAAFSVLVGVISGLFVFLELGIAFAGFVLGLGFGFFQMLRAFFDKMSGWGDLVGVMSLMACLLIGLLVGILVQFGYYLYKRNKK